jgi:hypothetical protein
MTIGFPRRERERATRTTMTMTTTTTTTTRRESDERVLISFAEPAMTRRGGAVRSVDEDDAEATGALERQGADAVADDDDDDDWIEVDAVTARRAFVDFVTECAIEAMASMEGRAPTEEEVRRVVQRASRDVERNRGGRRMRLKRAWRVLKRIYGGARTMNATIAVLMNPWSRRMLTFGMCLAGRVAWYSIFAAW